jgi:serine/threonine-protein kinase HipA
MTDELADGARLTVALGDTRIGVLVRTKEGSRFGLSDEYLRLPDRPILGQVFEDRPDDDHWVRQGVPPWFANLLPDPDGPLRKLLADRIGVKPERALFLLAALGQDLPGAVTITPENGLLPEHGDESAGAAATGEPLKFSLAGVQLKFSALRDDRGLTIPAQGLGGDWIVKLPDGRYPHVPENEFFSLAWAREAGLEVPPIELVEVDQIRGLPPEIGERGGAALAIRRFDRVPDGPRIHIEDFAQVLNEPPRHKYRHANYETLARVVAGTGRIEDVDMFLRRLVFDVLLGNGDAHLKNWSLIYRDGRHPQLAPAYDLLSTVVYMPQDTLGLNLGGNKAFEHVDIDAFRRLAERADLDMDRAAEVAERQVGRTVAAWPAIRNASRLPSSLRDTIQERLKMLPLAKVKG